jgi:predicted alpha/beta hydrolase
MMYRSAIIRTKDGQQITGRIYQPQQEPRGVVLIAPSLEVIQEDYYDIAVFFRDNNIAVITFDFRGTGFSAPETLKGYKANLENWAQHDLDAVLRYAKTIFPKQELIFIGHGIAGEIIGLAAASQFINRIVLVSSALSCSRLRRWQDKIWVGGMKKFVKFTCWLVGYFPGKRLHILNDLPRGVMEEWIHWCNNENGLFDDFPDFNYRKLQVPLLAFSFSDDWRSRETAVTALLQHFSSACIEWYHIRPRQLRTRRIGHSGFFKKKCNKDLWQMLLGWIDEKKIRIHQPCLTKKFFIRNNQQ